MEMSESNVVIAPWLQTVCKKLAENDKSLTTLDFHGKGIGDAGVKALAGGLSGNTALKVLILSYNGITAVGAKVLAGLFERNSIAVTTLYLEGNCIGDEGIMALASAFSVKTPVKVLNISRNGIGPVGGVAVARMLQQDTCSIQKLYMYGNHVGDEGARALGTSLKFNQALTQFTVQQNEFGNAGTGFLLEGAQGNYSLRSCSIDKSVKKETDHYTKLNRGGRFLLREYGLPGAFWVHVFAKVRNEPDLLFCFVRSNPDLFKRENQSKKTPEKTREKTVRQKLVQLAGSWRGLSWSTKNEKRGL